jgi:site-specific DNA-methyltransferase (adenine-specific)
MITLHNGDCLEVMKSIPDSSVDAIITDPPYGTTYCKWDSVIPFEPMWSELKRIIKPNGAIILFGSEPFSSALRMSNIKQYKYDWVWDKVNKFTGALNANKMPMLDHELISVFYNKQPTYNKQLRDGSYKTRHGGNRNTETINFIKPLKDYGRIINGLNPKRIIHYPSHNTKNIYHPTQKPIELMEYLIKTYSNENEFVLDFTMGSGTTGIACKNLNRNFIGIELDKNYFDIATKRINEVLL